VLTKKVWERIQKIAVSKQLQSHFKAKREKGVGIPFPHVPAPLHSWVKPIALTNKPSDWYLDYAIRLINKRNNHDCVGIVVCSSAGLNLFK